MVLTIVQFGLLQSGLCHQIKEAKLMVYQISKSRISALLHQDYYGSVATTTPLEISSMRDTYFFPNVKRPQQLFDTIQCKCAMRKTRSCTSGRNGVMNLCGTHVKCN